MRAQLQLACLLLALCQLSSAYIGITCPKLSGNAICQLANSGFEYSDGCNNVRCGGGGRSMTTLMLCDDPESEEDRQKCRQQETKVFNGLLRDTECPQLEPSLVCSTARAGFGYTDGCNEHVCDESGSAMSTMKACQQATSRAQKQVCSTLLQVVTSQLPMRTCQLNATAICLERGEGFSFSDGCNGISCTPSGKFTSTMMACDPAPVTSAYCQAVIATVQRQEPEPEYTCPRLNAAKICKKNNIGFSFNDGCNAVRCVRPGKAVTTLRFCPMPREGDEKASGYCSKKEMEMMEKARYSKMYQEPCVRAKDVCLIDSDSFYFWDGCNHCSCMGKGSARCTRMSCRVFFGTEDEFKEYCKAKMLKRND